MNILSSFRALSRLELLLWGSSVLIIGTAFVFSGNTNYLTLVASFIGATALIFVSKGDVLGQVLTVVFSLFYALISLDLRYYGEMITYLGMTTPIAVLSVFSWIKNPFEEGKSEVAIDRLSGSNTVIMVCLTFFVTFVFYFILRFFGTNNLLISTVSIATSFLASFLMLCRSPAYALAYAANDVVLIVLWIMASLEDTSYFPMVVCFLIFLVNDGYGFYNWKKLMKIQRKKRDFTSVLDDEMTF